MNRKFDKPTRVIRNTRGDYCLFVEARCVVHMESYAVVDQVRAALNGEHWPNIEAKEIAESIRLLRTDGGEENDRNEDDSRSS